MGNNILNGQSYDYDFSEIEKYGIGKITEYSDSIEFIMYQDKAPQKGDKIQRNGEIYECTSEIDITTDDEREDGLSYSKIELTRITENNVYVDAQIIKIDGDNVKVKYNHHMYNIDKSYTLFTILQIGEFIQAKKMELKVLN